MTERTVIKVVPAHDGWPDGILDFLGTEMANGEPSGTYEQRRGRCFELAAYCVALGTVPPNARLVHGSMHGRPRADDAEALGAEPVRIAHAWVELPVEGQLMIWEPIHAIIYDAKAFTAFARLWDERTYTIPSVRKLMSGSEHYGPWHECRYPSQRRGEVLPGARAET